MLNMTIFHPFHQNTGINGGWFQMFKKVTFQSIIYTVEKVPLTFFVNTRDKLKFQQRAASKFEKMAFKDIMHAIE